MAVKTLGWLITDQPIATAEQERVTSPARKSLIKSLTQKKSQFPTPSSLLAAPGVEVVGQTCLSIGDGLAGERMLTSSDLCSWCPLLPRLPEQVEQPLEKEKKEDFWSLAFL